MAPFRFRLERALQWNRERCAFEENRLKEFLAALNSVRESLARLQAEREAADRELIGRSSIQARELVALGLYRLRINQQRAQLDHDRAAREKAVEDQRALVKAARRRLQLIEKLRERRLAEHMYAEMRELENLAADSFLARRVTGEARKCQPQR